MSDAGIGDFPDDANPILGTSGLIAVDIGNTNVKALCRSADGRWQRRVTMLRDENWPDRIVDWAIAHATHRETIRWRVAAVHRGAVDRLETAVRCRAVEAGGRSNHPRAGNFRRVIASDLEMGISVDFPDRVGIDRLVGAWEAFREIRRSVIVVDAGSAITVDLVDDAGNFSGGAILPGIRMQTAALARGTDALPLVGPWEDAPPRGPGKNTEQAIRLGVMTAATATIDRLVMHYREHLRGGETPPVVITGGDATLLRTWLETETQLRRDLVCGGLLRLPLRGPAE